MDVDLVTLELGIAVATNVLLVVIALIALMDFSGQNATRWCLTTARSAPKYLARPASV